MWVRRSARKRQKTNRFCDVRFDKDRNSDVVETNGQNKSLSRSNIIVNSPGEITKNDDAITITENGEADEIVVESKLSSRSNSIASSPSKGVENDDDAETDIHTKTSRRSNIIASSPSKSECAEVDVQPKTSRISNGIASGPSKKTESQEPFEKGGESKIKEDPNDTCANGGKKDVPKTAAKVKRKRIRKISKKRNNNSPINLTKKNKTTSKPKVHSPATARKTAAASKPTTQTQLEVSSTVINHEGSVNEHIDADATEIGSTNTIGVVSTKETRICHKKRNLTINKNSATNTDHDDDGKEDEEFKLSDDNDENDDEDYDIQVTKRARKRNRKSSRSTVNGTRRCRTSPQQTPYQPLTPGDQFITMYGTVEVVSDDRIPSDYGTTPLETDSKIAASMHKKYRAKVTRLRDVKRRILSHVALVQMQRKNRLKRLNDQIRTRENDGGVVDNDEWNTKLAAGIWAEYCKCATPKEILGGFWSNGHKIDPTASHIQQMWQRTGGKGIVPPSWNGVAMTAPSNVKRKEEGYDFDPGIDPKVPIDSYPDRIVECLLLPDTRQRFGNSVVREEKMGRNNKLELTPVATSGLEIVNIVKLYLRRNTLTQNYDPLVPFYTCDLCGYRTNIHMAFKNHVNENICKKHSEEAFESRHKRLKSLEEAIITGDVGSFYMPKKAYPKRKPLKPGEKKPPKRKKGKKYPAWLLFYPESTTIYPEVYHNIGFRRGSNNSKFMKKKWDKIGLGRKRMRKVRSKYRRNEIEIILPSVYPEIWNFLFAGVSSAQRRIELYDAANSTGAVTESRLPKVSSPKRNSPNNLKRKVSRIVANSNDPKFAPMPPLRRLKVKQLMLPEEKLIELAPKPSKDRSGLELVPSTPDRLIEVALEPSLGGPDYNSKSKNVDNEDNASASMLPSTEKKKKRELCPIANPTPIAKNIVVDIRPLVEEIRGGRYPSMSKYIGPHSDICFLCKTDKDNVYFCEFCSNSEHLECVQTKVNVRDLEPDDEFMCHRCIGAVLSRRNRAEKRRLQKLDVSLGLPTDTIVGSGNGKGIATIVSSAVNPTLKTTTGTKSEVVWSQSDFDCHKVSYGKCPIGGPGGLICCRSCSSAYSRFLINTTREMEGQTISKVGQDVSELMELLLDAQVRLKQSLDVMNTNDVRRTLLDRDEIDYQSQLNCVDETMP